MNVTLVPAQIVLSASLDAMLTLTGKFGFTVVVMLLEVAEDVTRQGLAFDVSKTLTTSPLAKVVVV